jgi:hypothetical protein
MSHYDPVDSTPKPQREASSLSDRVSSPRIAVFTHDTFGLGHVRRCLHIIRTLAGRVPQITILFISGSPVLHMLKGLPQNADFVKIPTIVKTGSAGSLPLTGFINGWLHHKGTKGPPKHKANVTSLLCGFGECLWCCGVNLVYETACPRLPVAVAEVSLLRERLIREMFGQAQDVLQFDGARRAAACLLELARCVETPPAGLHR